MIKKLPDTYVIDFIGHETLECNLEVIKMLHGRARTDLLAMYSRGRPVRRMLVIGGNYKEGSFAELAYSFYKCPIIPYDEYI